jgi:ligand-binding sensor domain-containing protein
LWIAINEGLIRYDGIHSKKYQPENNVFVSSIYEDDDSDLWVVTGYKKLHFYDRRLDRFEKIELKDSIQFLNSVTQDSDGNILIAADYYIYSYSKHRKTSRSRKLSAYPRMLYRDSTNMIWLGALDGLYQYFPDRKKFLKKMLDYKDRDDILCMEREGDFLWVGSVSHFNKLKIKDSSVVIDKTYIENDVIFSTSKTPMGSRFIAGHQFFYEIRKGKLFKINDFKNVRDLYFNENKLWISSKVSEELYKIDHLKNSFQKSSLFSGYVKQYYLDSKDRIWVIHQDGVSLKKNKQSSLDPISNIGLYRLFEIEKQIYFTGGYGLYKFDDSSGKIIKISKEILTSSAVVNYNNDYLLATYKFSDLFLIHKKNLTEVPLIEKGASSTFYQEMHQSGEGDFWFISNNGIHKLDSTKKIISHKYIERYEQNNFTTGFFDSEGLFWLGNVNKQLIAFNPRTNAFKDYTATIKNLELKSQISEIIEDSDKNLWFITKKRLHKVTLDRSSKEPIVTKLQFFDNHGINQISF